MDGLSMLRPPVGFSKRNVSIVWIDSVPFFNVNKFFLQRKVMKVHVQRNKKEQQKKELQGTKHLEARTCEREKETDTPSKRDKRKRDNSLTEREREREREREVKQQDPTLGSHTHQAAFGSAASLH